LTRLPIGSQQAFRRNLEKPPYRAQGEFMSVTLLKKPPAAAVLVILGIFLVNATPAVANPDQRRFSLVYFDVDVTYPPKGNPGETITISITATAKKDCEVQDLSVELFVYSASGDPRSIGSTTVARQVSVASGNCFQKSVAYTIPMDAPRSFLMAVVSETIRTYSYSYSYYYVYPYWWWHNVTRYWWGWYPVYYGWRTYTDIVDKEAGPLTYVLATTPEYVQLKADYDKLTSDYNRLSSEYSALSARYNRLSEEQQRLASENESLIQALMLTRTIVYCLVVGVAVVALLLYLRKKGTIVVKLQRPTSTPEQQTKE